VVAAYISAYILSILYSESSTMGQKKKEKICKGNIMGGNTTNAQEERFETRLVTILLTKSLVSSPEESTSIAEAIILEMNESELPREDACVSSLEDYFSLSKEDARATLSALFNLDDISNSSNSGHDDTDEDPFLRADEASVDSDSDDGEYIGEGECELCERFIRLTKHHLIPRSTWPRILPRLTSAALALSKDDVHRAGLILGSGLSHFLEPLTIADGDKVAIKGLLKRTCTICRSCHSAIHRTYPNMVLATDYSTTDLLMQDEKIYKYCKWASKQKPGKYSKFG